MLTIALFIPNTELASDVAIKLVGSNSCAGNKSVVLPAILLMLKLTIKVDRIGGVLFSHTSSGV